MLRNKVAERDLSNHLSIRYHNVSLHRIGIKGFIFVILPFLSLYLCVPTKRDGKSIFQNIYIHALFSLIMKFLNIFKFLAGCVLKV